MAVSRAQKEEAKKKLQENFDKSTAIYFTEYSGLSVQQMSELREKLTEAGSEMLVAKKSLIKKVADEKGYKDIPEESLAGPVAAVFSYEDQVAPAKAVHTFFKEFENLSLLGALMDGKAISKADTQQLATLPSRDELLAKLVGSMNAPISGFHGVLHGVMRQFVGTVAAYKDQKEQAA